LAKLFDLRLEAHTQIEFRRSTERMQALAAGVVKWIGTNKLRKQMLR